MYGANDTGNSTTIIHSWGDNVIFDCPICGKSTHKTSFNSPVDMSACDECLEQINKATKAGV